MARQVIHELIDDLDGSPAQETVQFGFKGKIFEIDLNERNAGALTDCFGEYADRAREIGRLPSAPRSSRVQRTVKSTPPVDTAAVRAWAMERGVPVSDRGRLPASVIEAYEDARRI